MLFSEISKVVYKGCIVREESWIARDKKKKKEKLKSTSKSNKISLILICMTWRKKFFGKKHKTVKWYMK